MFQNQCDPSCIPYLGMYLTDLSIIEEGTPGNTEGGLVNFSKMRTVTNYLLDANRLLDDDQTYRASLEIEP
uniref:Ras-GEF domain-containing protein n=1 Tax=Magallana gigas TaxID=29159 RepID=A0A8W8HS37_MAGGI